VTVMPTSAGSGDRRIRIQGMPARRWLATTPGRFRTASVVLVVGLIVFAIAATAAVRTRGDAGRRLALHSTPELLAAENLYGNLADADAMASTIFLRAGGEPAELRQRYLHDVEQAGAHLAAVARLTESSGTARRAIRTILQELPAYTGSVESARANIRQGFAVGGSYLRDASARMRDRILPAATDLYRDAALGLAADYRTGTSTATFLIVVVAGVAMLTLVAVVLVYARRRSNRLVNVGVLTAGVVVVGLLAWILACFSAGHDAMNRAERRGSDSVEVLASARILTLRAQNNENLALIERGTGDQYVVEFDRAADALGSRDGTGGLLGDAATVADRTGDRARITALTDHFNALGDVHTRVRALDDGGNWDDAVGLSVGKGGAAADGQGQGQELLAVQRLERGLQTEIMRAQARLEAAATDARNGFGVLLIAIPVFAIVAGFLVLVGLERRIAEYR
jgi:hypothetical protein